MDKNGSRFIRPDQKVKHPEHESPVIPEDMPSDIEIFFELFQNCFQGHVEPHLSAKGHRIIPTKDDAKKRGVQNDLLTAYFQMNVYSPSELSMSASMSPVDLARRSGRDYKMFFEKVTASPMSDDFDVTGNPGTNRLNFLSGSIGCGKSLLLAKLTTDSHNHALNFLSDENPSADAIIPIFLDFEILLGKVRDKFPEIDSTFTQMLSDATERQLSRYARLRKYISILKNPTIPFEARFKDLCKKLLIDFKPFRVRFLIVLDNVDRYHFYYTKFSFFEAYRIDQIDSIRRNLDKMLTILCENDFLGDCSLCIVLACRPETLHAFSHHSSVLHGNASRLRDLGVFHLSRSEHWPLVESRLNLMEAAISSFREVKPTTYAQYDAYLDLMKSVLGRSCAPADSRHWRNSLHLISDFAHQGPRSFLSFLSDLRLDWRNNSDIIQRVFGRATSTDSPHNIDPHNLLRLYISNNKQRYSQASGHFPNLFLVDATYAYDPNFSNVKISHGHTYWLKYLLLKYIVENTSTDDDIVTLNEVIKLFSPSFDENLIRLVLGSLASTETSGCIEVVESSNSSVVRITATKRGRAFFRVRADREWCLSWDYLQFVVDDYQMSYPEMVWDKVYSRHGGLGYLLRPSGVYSAELARDVAAKARGCIYFIHLLALAKAAELNRRAHTNKTLALLYPDMDSVYSSFIRELESVLAHVRNGDTLLQSLKDLHQELAANVELADVFLAYGSDTHYVMEPA